jgi:hypothetical protein
MIDYKKDLGVVDPKALEERDKTFLEKIENLSKELKDNLKLIIDYNKRKEKADKILKIIKKRAK